MGSGGYGTAAMAAFSITGGPPAQRAARGRLKPVTAHVAGMDARLDPSGVLYWPDERTLVVSDLHLETGSSFARRGQMVPPYDTAITLARLADAFDRYNPARVVALGDSFHDPHGPERLGKAERDALLRMTGAAEFIWIAGNHDGTGAAALGGTAREILTIAGVTFRHVPTEGRPAGAEVAGHLHPAARIARGTKRRCFVGCAVRLVMPALGCLTGGLPVTNRAFAALWPDPPGPRLHVMGRERVYSI